MIRSATALCASIAVSACASMPAASVTPPDFTPITTTSAPHAALYADCIAQAVAADRYGRAYDEVHVVVFTCDGRPARVFFDALADWSARTGSEVVVGDRTIRPTTRIERDLFAADYCERREAAYSCAVSLRTGEFVAE
ncbi:MAG: hypothetical protein KKA16_15140 [Alphaproteobacteria bacterium]|nr:hypothetical protein [Alphaproteobacteria bacterium]MBU2380066.1 hypothetical protein [Alphaproteobacteria bacterium]